MHAACVKFPCTSTLPIVMLRKAVISSIRDLDIRNCVRRRRLLGRIEIY